jgi:hypothetical protein
MQLDNDNSKGKYKDEKILKKLKNQVENAYSANQNNLKMYRTAQEFTNTKEGQWESNESAYYSKNKKPKVCINRIINNKNKLISEVRGLKRNVELRPIAGYPENEAAAQKNEDNIELRQSMLESISMHSSANKIYEDSTDRAYFGWGAWRIKYDYESDDSFYKSFKIIGLPNSMRVYWDPNAQDITSLDPKDHGDFKGFSMDLTANQIKSQYKVDLNKDKNLLDDNVYSPTAFTWQVSSGSSDDKGHDTYTVCHHYYKKYYNKKVVQVDNGFKSYTFDLEEAEEKIDELNSQIEQEIMMGGQPQPLFKIVKERTVATYKIKEVIFCGKKILAKQDWINKHFPVVTLFSAHYINDKGEFCVIPESYFAQDPQKMLNIVLSAIADAATKYRTERIVMSPQNLPQDADRKESWRNPDQVNGILMFHPTTAFPRPEILPNKEIPQSLLVTMNEMNQIMNDALNRSPTSQMSPGGLNTSGKAIDSINREDNKSNSILLDELNRMITYTNMIISDGLHVVYDTYRQISINTSNGAKNVVINDDQKPETMITKKDYEISVHCGPAFEVQRQETANAILQLFQLDPTLISLMGDIFAKNLNVNNAQEIADRMNYKLDPRVLKKIGAAPIPPLPQQGPPPQMQIEMMKLQMDQKKMQLDQLNAQMENQTKQQQQQLDMRKQQLQEEMTMMEYQMNLMKLQQEGQADQMKAQTDTIRSRAEIIKAVEGTHSAIQTARMKNNAK